MRLYPNTTVDSEFKTLRDAGYSGTLNDMQFSFLRSQGYTNSLPDMMTSWLSFSPSILFSANEPGLFLDPSDTATLFQDPAGTTPVTTPGQSVALALDKSRGLVLGPELVTNGDFSAGTTGWAANNGATISVVSGELQVVSAGLTYGGAVASFPTVAGRTYRATFTARRGTANLGWLLAGSTFGNSDLGVFQYTLTTNAQYSAVFVAVGATTFITVQANNTVSNGSVFADNISVRELPGNHATQATAGSRPLYALLPANGVRNLANGSADVGNNAVWLTGTTQNGITMTKVASGFDVDGLPYVDVRYQGTSTGTNHDQILPFSFAVQSGVAGQSATCSVIARVISGSVSNVLGFRARMSEETAPSTFIGIALGTPVTASTDTVTTATRTLSTGNQFRATLSLDFNTASAIDVTYRVKAIQVELGSTRTAYQFNYSNVNIAQPPFAQVGALLFDGVDDFLQTPSVDFAGYQILGSELVTNGDFATDTWWSKDATATIAGGVGVFTNTPASSGFFRSALLQTGVFYSVTYTISSITSGAVRVLLGTGSSVVQSSAGTYTEIIQCSGSGQLYVQAFSGSATNATVDNISVREVLRPADKMTVFAGVRKLSDATRGVVVELTNAASNRFGVEAPSFAAPAYLFTSFGTSAGQAQTTSFASPDTAVLTGVGDISGDIAILRRNGTQVATSAADQGTGNFANSILYIGRRGGTSLPFNGYLYSLIVRGAATPSSLITQTERWVNQRTGAY